MDTRPTSPNYTVTTLSLRVIKFGHEYPGGSINVRVPSATDAERMADSIRREGLLQPLLVVPHPETGELGPYFAVIGGRRLAGLQRLRELGEIEPTAPVAVMIAPDLGTSELLAKSLAAEDAHVPPHPVDRYESFAALARLGMTTEDIAARHFIDSRVVRQAMALGELHEDIRKAYRAGEISGDIAQLFTLADDPKHQVKVLDKLRKKFTGDHALADIRADTVRKYFTASEVEARRMLAFVGRDAYTAAGGRLTEDLFAGTDAEPSLIVHDVAKLKKLAEGKLEIEARRLTEGEGWSWADTRLKHDYMGGSGMSQINAKPDYSAEEKRRLAEIKKRQVDLEKALRDLPEDGPAAEWPRIEEEIERIGEELLRVEADAALRAYKPEQKAKAGCIVEIGNDGRLVIKHGLVKPKESQEPAGSQPAAPRSAAKVEAEKLSWEARRHVGDVRDHAIAAGMINSPTLALAAYLASYCVDQGPLMVGGGHGDIEPPIKAKTWRGAFAQLSTKTNEELVRLLAPIIGDFIEIDECDEDAAALMAAIDIKAYDKHIAEEFEPKIYFGGASVKFMLDLIAEDLGDDERRRNADKSQKQLAAFCLDSVAVKGWLPPELRGPNYAPGKKAPAADPKAKAKVTATVKKAKPAKKAKRK